MALLIQAGLLAALCWAGPTATAGEAVAEVLDCELSLTGLGGPLALSIQPADSGYRERTGEKLTLTSAGRVIGFLSYSALNGTLWIGDLEVDRPFRRQGVSEYLFAKVLERVPETRTVAAMLAGTNMQLLKVAMNDGLPCAEAIKTTPAYRLRLRFGFSEIVMADCGTLPELEVTRPRAE